MLAASDLVNHSRILYSMLPASLGSARNLRISFSMLLASPASDDPAAARAESRRGHDNVLGGRASHPEEGVLLMKV